MNREAQIAEKIAKLLSGRSVYENVIVPILVRLGRRDIDPRHVEAYLRLERGTLDSMSRHDFERIMPEIIDTIDADPITAEKLAKSEGL